MKLHDSHLTEKGKIRDRLYTIKADEFRGLAKQCAIKDIYENKKLKTTITKTYWNKWFIPSYTYKNTYWDTWDVGASVLSSRYKVKSFKYLLPPIEIIYIDERISDSK